MAAVTAENRPATHASHTDEAVLASYLPTGHAWHVFSLVASVAVEKRPATHASHTDEAVLASYLPGAHTAHTDEAVLGAYLPAGHAWHAFTFVAFNTVEKRPG